jgi:hypothetical protein
MWKPTQFKWCSQCHASFDPAGSNTKTCSEECKQDRIKERQSSPEARHTILKRILEAERAPRTDKLWSLNFYSGLIQGNECTWCSGPLSRTGHAIDRLDSTKPHSVINLAGIACQRCNRVHSGPDKNGNTENAFSFEEMKLLRPALVTMRIRKGNTKRGEKYER